MNSEDYQMQILLEVAKGCKPNSPYPGRAWVRVKPLWRHPEFGDVLCVLIRKGLLQRKHGFRVKPTAEGYSVIYQLKAQRQALRARPALFTRLVWDNVPVAE